MTIYSDTRMHMWGFLKQNRAGTKSKLDTQNTRWCRNHTVQKTSYLTGECNCQVTTLASN